MKNPGRTCTVCNYQHKPNVPALYVASSARGTQWFECANHNANDNALGQERTRLQPIEEFFSAIDP